MSDSLTMDYNNVTFSTALKFIQNQDVLAIPLTVETREDHVLVHERDGGLIAALITNEDGIKAYNQDELLKLFEANDVLDITDYKYVLETLKNNDSVIAGQPNEHEIRESITDMGLRLREIEKDLQEYNVDHPQVERAIPIDVLNR